MEDHQIVQLFLLRSQQAIAEMEQKYGRYCQYIAQRFLQDPEDAREVVNDACLKVWNTIPPNRPESLKGYVGMITRQLALDAWDARHAQKRGTQVPLALEELAECIPDGTGEALVDRLALRDALNRFIRSLPERTGRIFIRRYFYADPVRQIARDFGMKESAVTVLMLRTRKKLKEFLQKEELEP